MRYQDTKGLLLLVLLLLTTTAMGCIRRDEKEYGGRGDFLSIGAYKPKLLDRVVYTFQDENYVITPQEEGMVIAAVSARAVNLKSSQVTLSLDENSATLRGENGEVFLPFEPGLRAEKTSDSAPDGNPYGRHLWGQIQLIQGFEVAGWFFYDVPEGLDFLVFVWEDVESVSVPYPK